MSFSLIYHKYPKINQKNNQNLMLTNICELYNNNNKIAYFAGGPYAGLGGP